ncbi:MAG: carboxypeptidase-like regulatory domain-containing protein [Nanoarchaeota archaeon]
MRLFRAFCFVFAVLLFSFSLWSVGAADTRSISVFVKDTTGSPIEGAHVVATVQGTGQEVDMGDTGDTGYTAQFEFTLDTYLTLEVSADGYDASITYDHWVFFVPSFTVTLIGGDDDDPPQGSPHVIDEKLRANQECEGGYVEQGMFVDGVGDIYRFCVQKVYGTFVPGTYVNFSYFESDTGSDECLQGGVSVGTFRYGYGSDDFARLCVDIDHITEAERNGISPIVLDSLVDDACYTNPVYNFITGPIYLPSGGVVYHCAKVLNWDEADEGDCEISEARWINPDNEIYTPDGNNIAGPVNGFESGRLPGERVHAAVDIVDCLEEIVIFEIYEGQDTAVWALEGPTRTFTVSNPRGSFAYNVPAWEPPWFDDPTPGTDENDPVYYAFIAKVQGISTELDHSPFLQVERPPERECENNDDCAEGRTCDEDGRCAVECEDDGDCDGNVNGEICCDDADKCSAGSCVDCYDDTNCISQYGEGYSCDAENYCTDGGGCQLTGPVWLSEDGNPITGGSVRGWGDDQEKKDGDIVRMKVTGTRACLTEEVLFTVYEANVGVDNEVVQLSSTYVHGLDFYVPAWEPPWNIEEWLSIFEGDELEYYFVASGVSSESRHSQPDLIVIDPGDAVCDEDVAEGEDDGCSEGGVCDGGSCVAACSEDDDCEGDLVCEEGSCVECVVDDDCTDDEKPKCNSVNVCVECYDASHCSEDGETCDTNSMICVPICTSDDDCEEDELCNIDEGFCVGCLSDDDCASASSGEFCNVDGNNQCVACLNDDHCDYGQYCDLEEHACYSVGFGGLEMIGSSLGFAAILAIVGFMVGGPMGAILGGILGIIVGGGIGGFLGGLF